MITLKTTPIPINQKYGVINGRMILQKKYRDTKEALAWEIRSQWPHKPHSEDLCLNVVMFLGTKRKTDTDAYIKILMDSGEGVLYENDYQISELHVFRKYDPKSPRVELTLTVINTFP